MGRQLKFACSPGKGEETDALPATARTCQSEYSQTFTNVIEIANGLGMTSMVWAKNEDGTPRVSVAAWPMMCSAETEMEALVKLVDTIKKTA